MAGQWFNRPGSNLATLARETGYPVIEVSGWSTRGNGSLGSHVGVVVCHHTAGPEPEQTSSNYPSLNVVTYGRPGLDGPLSHFGIGYDGTIYVIAAGLAYHAGAGGWAGFSGNSTALGIEAEDSGDGDWTPQQLDVYPRLAARICQFLGIGASAVCFPEDVLILCRDGLKPISYVQVGDEVWTHKERWRPVTAVHSRVAETVTVKGQGHPGLVTTAEHPFLSAVVDRGRIEGRPGGNYRRVHGTEWVAAGSMVGRHWATPTEFGDEESIPPIRSNPGERAVEINQELFWVLGRWAADGSASGGRIALYGGPGEATEIEEHCRAAGLRCRTSQGSTATRTAIGSTALERWFHEHFGRRASAKTVPAWLLGAHPKYREAFLDGYLSGDGYWMNSGRNEASSVSKRLAVGVKLLAQSLGWSSALYHEHRQAGEIQGRAVNQQSRWRLRLTRYQSHRQQYFEYAGYRFGRVRSVEPSGEDKVHNITVAEDESFLADGIVVHNCGHKEWAPNRKTDPAGIDMDDFRAQVADYLAHPETIRKEDGMPSADEVAEAVWKHMIHNHWLDRGEWAETVLGANQDRVIRQQITPMRDQVAALARAVAAQNGITAEDIAAALVPRLSEELLPTIEAAVTDALGQDNAGQAEAIIDRIAQRLAGGQAGSSSTADTSST
ncbi:N-acetylmuramoyl-L-alanine amidase [Haloactinomyces albus]|uniref:N-acetylmuramoyl-L-alanine amidase n=1 Tax=Haloactinomyces albus TaxID=1352928 RepID=A0AAE4CMR2_9ACTN|nr:N-acetylmuramoyl-L-alanine amidase [Haloactinomyces albus]MDR7302696.1 intein/homing endonuclease [Haloactinomyces albus]